MSFEFTQKKVLKCVECGHIQLKKHFRSDGSCTLCRGESKVLRTINNSGPTFNDKQLYRSLGDVDGVGDTTAAAIRDSFDVEGFLDACRNAYEENDTTQLEQVTGVGEATAQRVASYVGDQKDWEERNFTLREDTGFELSA